MTENISIERILKELYQISGFRISIYDTSFHEIAAYPQNLGCLCSLVQQTTEGKKHCINHDVMAFDKVRKQERLHIYKCYYGLYEAVAPLYSFETLTGYLMMGQTLESGEEIRSLVFERALPYVEDPEVLHDTIERIPVRDQNTINSLVTIMEICAQYITLTNRMHLTQNELISEVHDYIQKQYDRHITIDDLCAQFFCSRSSLTRKFKETYGISIHDYISKVRLENSCHLLRSTSLSVGEIAFRCGYNDQNYFTRAFCKSMKMTPREYRKSF
ncbi:MAG: helix-turn-helix domain-containing protein [Blautia sp.]